MQPRSFAVQDPSGLVRAVQEEYAGALFLFAYRAIGNPSDAEDVVQEVLVRVWRGARRYDPERGTVSTWLFTIARNVVIDHQRRARVRPQVAGNGTVEGLDGPAGDDDPTAFDRALEAWQMAEAMRRLTPEHRDVIVETYYRDRSVAQAAAQLGIPPGTVKSRLYYGLRKLRDVLVQMGVVG